MPVEVRTTVSALYILILREEYYEFLIAEMDVNVHNLSKEENLSLILSNTENSTIRASAKFCSQILERRRSF